jgi:hypothetical protein
MIAAESFRRDRRLERDVVRDVEELITSILDADTDIDQLEPEERLKLRLQVVAMLEALPSFELSVKEWVTQARQVIKESFDGMDALSAMLGRRIRTPSNVDGLVMQSLLSQRDLGPHVQTVHSVKGESHEATLLIAVEQERVPQNWHAWLGDGEQEEERIAYVALTRARRYMAIALPQSCPAEVVERYLERGFVASPDP